MRGYIPDSDIFYEIYPYNNQIKIIIYATVNRNKKVFLSPKCDATHILEQVFDNSNNWVSEKLKPFEN